MTATKRLLCRALLPGGAILASCLVALATGAEASAQSAPPTSTIDCASTKPVTVDTAQLAALYRVLNSVAGDAKSEWETTPSYIARRQEALNAALAKSTFKCPRIIVRVPIVWKFDANTGLMNTYGGGYSAQGMIELGDLQANLGPNTGGIYRGASKIGANFDFTVNRYNVAPRPKSAASISKCLQRALRPPSVFGYGYELESAWCVDQQWNVELRISNARLIFGSYNIPVEEAKRLRATGVFLYLDVSLTYNYTDVDEEKNKWLMFSSLNSATIGDSSGAQVGVAPSIDPEWLRKPSVDDIARYYPDRAQRMEVNGQATLSCTGTAKGTLEGCSVVSESPADYGFGDAAMKLSRWYRIAPLDGVQITIPIDFSVPH